jgi:GGDEF domain-containing protein
MAIMLIALSMTGTVRYRREERIERLAARDPLTALYNRRALEVRAPALFKDVSPERPGALLLIDIDHFKLVNDLRPPCRRRPPVDRPQRDDPRAVAGTAIAARPGGDEFVILLADASRARIEALAEALRQQFHTAAHSCAPRSGDPEHRCPPVRPPAGQPGGTDRAGRPVLYASKRAGRNSLQLMDGSRSAVTTRQGAGPRSDQAFCSASMKALSRAAARGSTAGECPHRRSLQRRQLPQSLPPHPAPPHARAGSRCQTRRSPAAALLQARRRRDDAPGKALLVTEDGQRRASRRSGRW